MTHEYKVATFVPVIKGCGARDAGWNVERCQQFEKFLNEHALAGWRLHNAEYREVMVQGCGGNRGVQLVCTFEKENRAA